MRMSVALLVAGAMAQPTGAGVADFVAREVGTRPGRAVVRQSYGPRRRAEHEPCSGRDVDPWVVAAAERLRGYDGLLGFAVAELGQPVECEGMVTDEFDGSSYGVVRFRFSGGATFELETMPPSVTITTLHAPAGFDDPERVIEAVRSYTNGLGLSIDWTDSERTMDGQATTEQFWDPDPGLNASASLTSVSGVLVTVRVSLAP